MIQPFDSTHLRNALGSFVTGVTIVSTHDNEMGDVGLTANSFNSVSLDPPLVLWSLAKTAMSRPAFERGEYFAVHILSADQQSLSNTFASAGADKFAGLEVDRGPAEIPLLTGCSARFQCRTAYRYEGGDHIIFVGEVVEFDHYGRTPLAFHSGQYAVTAKKAEPLSRPDAAYDVAPDGSFGEDFVGYLLGRSYFQLFGQLKSARERLGLSIRQYFVISLLTIRGELTLEELVSMLDYTGYVIDEKLIRSIVGLGLVTVEGEAEGEGEGLICLNDGGRAVALELIAIAKAAEADALAHFDAGERQMLKQLLKRFIKVTDPGVPDIWCSSEHDERDAAQT